MRTMTVVRQHLAAAFLIVIGMIAHGCGDSATVNPEATLANLTVTDGSATATLDPVFNPATTNYTVNLSNNITTVTITAQPAVAGDTVTIDGQTTTSTSIDLGSSVLAESTKTVSIVVSNPPSSSKTYIVSLKRAGLTGNNSLQNLDVSPGTPPITFNKITLNYTVSVLNTVNTITVTPTLDDPAATMTVNGQATNSGQLRTITLNGPGQTTTIPIVVTAQNGTPQTYTVNVIRAALSGNNNLSALTVSPGPLDDPFNANDLNYTVNVGSTVASVTVTPTRQDPNATITVNGQAATSGQPRTITLNGAGSDTFINIVVTAPNGTQKVYTVNVRRAALGGNNNLSALTVSPGTLNPNPFNASALSYTVNVGSTVANITVTPTLQATTASMTVNGQATNSGQARTVTLNGAGSNTVVSIAVTAQNGSQKVYTVNVSRASLGGNNNLSGLTVSPGALNSPFSANDLTYTVEVATNVTSVTVTPTLQDTAATMTVNGQATNSGQARTIQLNGPGSNTVINIAATAPNGSSKTYTITVERAAQASNNNLSALSVTPGPLTPTFAQNTLNYTANVASTVSSVNVSATKADPNSVMSEDVTAGAGTATGQATIQLGGQGTATVVLITVTAPNGNSKTYRITVNRALPSSNNNLSALTVSQGSLTPSFAAATEDYTVSVATDVSSINVSATKADANAVMSGSMTAGTGVPTGQATIPLNGAGASTPISITVTAPNGNSKTYSITVNRALAEPPAPSVAPNLITADDSCSPGIPPDECAPGTSKEDNVTNVTTPGFSIPQPGSGETATLYVNGSKDASSSTSGNLLRPSTSLSDGTYTITYTLNSSGGESNQSPPLTVTINTVAPGQ